MLGAQGPGLRGTPRRPRHFPGGADLGGPWPGGGRAWGQGLGWTPSVGWAAGGRASDAVLPASGGPDSSSWGWTGTGPSSGQGLWQRLGQGNRPKAYCMHSGVSYTWWARAGGEMALPLARRRRLCGLGSSWHGAVSGHCPGLTRWEQTHPCSQGSCLVLLGRHLLLRAGLGLSCACIPSPWLRAGLGNAVRGQG